METKTWLTVGEGAEHAGVSRDTGLHGLRAWRAAPCANWRPAIHPPARGVH